MRKPARNPKNAPPGLVMGGWLSQLAGEQGIDFDRLAALQSDLDQYCASSSCGRVLARDSGQDLVLISISAGQAAKLRNLKTGLAQFLHQRGWQFAQVKIKLQPANSPKDLSALSTPRRATAKPGLSPATLKHWQELKETLEPGPLLDAVDALIKHQQ
jgi:hypothetical protein